MIFFPQNTAFSHTMYFFMIRRNGRTPSRFHFFTLKLKPTCSTYLVNHRLVSFRAVFVDQDSGPTYTAPRHLLPSLFCFFLYMQYIMPQLLVKFF